MKINIKAFFHSTQKKCPLCSQLSSGFKGLFDRFFGKKIDCLKDHLDTYDSEADRVRQVNQAAPNCECEAYRMSKFSSAPIDKNEYLSRFVFSPIHLNRKGEIKPSLFSHVSTIGCSIQRETIASNDEIGNFISKFLRNDIKYSWNGVLMAKSDDLRKVLVESTSARALCLYDTAEKDNPSHGEIHQTVDINEADQIELRHDIMQAFVSAKKLTPNSYRNGDVLGIVPEQFKSQIA